MHGRSAILATLLLAGGLALAPPPQATAGPLVVELYTSQGCSTCPPADALLGELKQRADILPLSLHVTYWDYLGWRDPYATEEGTERQREYARRFGIAYVYTPQMVIDGRAHTAGHRRGEVERAIGEARAGRAHDIDLVFGKTPAGQTTVTIPASAFAGDADVRMMVFDDRHTTEVRAGENGGRTLTYHNVVRDIRMIGTYRGEAVTYTLPMDPVADVERDGCAVLVQEAGQGAVIAAGVIPTPG